MILTVTLNPCVDRTIEIEKFLYGGTNKVLRTQEDISGKGINVSLALQNLGIQNKAAGFSYQEDKEKLERFFKEIHCPYTLYSVPGALRVNVKIFDTEKRVMSEFNDKGREVTEQDVAEFLALLDKEWDKTDILVVDGSVPPGVPRSIYRDLIQKANEKGVKTILDASGDLLSLALPAKPFFVKPNRGELEILYGKAFRDKEEMLSFGKTLIQGGVHYLCISRGEEGAVFLTESKVYQAKPVKVLVQGVQGAGDSMVAGACLAMMEGLPDKEVFRYAVACATGSLLHPGTELCERQDLEEMLSKVEIEEIK